MLPVLDCLRVLNPGPEVALEYRVVNFTIFTEVFENTARELRTTRNVCQVRAIASGGAL